jgi:hypothetical protein
MKEYLSSEAEMSAVWNLLAYTSVAAAAVEVPLSEKAAVALTIRI